MEEAEADIDLVWASLVFDNDAAGIGGGTDKWIVIRALVICTYDRSVISDSGDMEGVSMQNAKVKIQNDKSNC
jgi:hypothetical protein